MLSFLMNYFFENKEVVKTVQKTNLDLDDDVGKDWVKMHAPKGKKSRS
jgi:hypothetical protein